MKKLLNRNGTHNGLTVGTVLGTVVGIIIISSFAHPVVWINSSNRLKEKKYFNISKSF